MTSEQNAPGDFENIENGKKLPGIHHNDAFEQEEDATPPPDQPQSSQDEVASDLEYNNPVIKCLITPLQLSGKLFTKYSKQIRLVIFALIIIAYTGYMIAALIKNFNRALPLLVIFCLVILFKIYGLVKNHAGESIWKTCSPAYDAISKNVYWIKWILVLVLISLLAVWIALDTSKRPNQLISIAGYVTFVFLLFLTSNNPAKVRWRPVFWGLGIEICLGVFILRTDAGFQIFNWLGNFAQTFLDFVTAGSKFLFGPLFANHFFAFKVLPIIIYFSSFISVLYYLGAMQWLIYKISWLMQLSLGTSATESMCAAGNIFVGQTESPLLIRPYLKDLTTSELHAVMTAGFGTIAGSVLGAYLGFGIKAAYVITASVMAAPCALAISKLAYPETKKSKFMTMDGIEAEKPDHKNVIEAAFVGASSSIPLVLNIAANLIAFLSLLAAINGLLGWYGGLLDYPQLSFELICSYVFLPVTFLMGIEWQDCFKCAELLGIKIFLNEFIAYQELSGLIDNRADIAILRENANGTVNWISERSEAIITYALCGFANIGSIGVMLGGLTAMCPEKQGEATKIVVRALISGISVSILNACVAGFFYLPPPTTDCNQVLYIAVWNGTLSREIRTCCEQEILNATSTNACRCCNVIWPSGYETLSCESNANCS